jgi:hypothetical protein
MKEESVNLTNVDADNLTILIKKHFQELGLQIIHEEKHDGYYSIKAYRGGKMAAVTGSIRDVEIMISGTDGQHELTLRTGAWGRDIAIPALLVSMVTFAGAAAVAAAEIYRAHKFEKDFWTWLNIQVASYDKAKMSQPTSKPDNMQQPST